MDVCGLGRHVPQSYLDNTPPKNAELVLSRMGLFQHGEPKRKDFLSQTDRENNFVQWPEMVKQTPNELAEAGFFYWGWSDQVCCFHLCNWEKDHDPWEEHARRYPECKYVMVKKGQEFIDKMRQEKSAINKASSATNGQTITEPELDLPMESDIIKATLSMGFPADTVRAALLRLEQTGLSFFRLETCIDAVVQYMKEEICQALQQPSSRSVETEAAAQQEDKTEVLQSATRTLWNSHTTTAVNATSSLSSSSSSSSSLSSSLTSPSLQPDPESSSSEEPMDDVLSQTGQVTGLPEPALNTSSYPIPSHSSGHSLVTFATTTPSAASISRLPASSGISALPSSHSPDAVKMKKHLSFSDKFSSSGKPHTPQGLAANLEISDSRRCKMCKDAEVDVMFLPCSHMVTCSSCALVLTQCPICRSDIKYTIKPILC